MSVNLSAIEALCESIGSGDDEQWAELRDQHVPALIAEVRKLRLAIGETVAALTADEGTYSVPDFNEWADSYRVRNALNALGHEEEA